MPIRIVALGGTVRASSSGSAALRLCLQSASQAGCEVSLYTGPDIDLPMYDPTSATRAPQSVALVEALRNADGLLIASPGYHGSISGLVKNALDYTEDLRGDARCYLTNVPVGCIVSAAGWQAGGTTLAALRSVVHALRGWPTPLGVMFNSSAGIFAADGVCTDDSVRNQLTEMTSQVIAMARLQKNGRQ